MALVAKTLDQVVRFVSADDPSKGTPEEATQATVFLLAPLSARQMAAIRDATTAQRLKVAEPGKEPELEGSVNVNERCYLMAQASLRGWERFMAPNGSEHEFKVASRIVGGERVAGASQEAMDLLGMTRIIELGVEVGRISQPEAADLKS